MYLLVNNVPFRPRDAGSVEVASDWARSLVLLRDSFNGHFGEIVVAAPTVPLGEGPIGEQQPASLQADADGISFVALGDTRWRARHFWRHFPRIRSTCRELARRADVVHAGINNLYQPYSFVGFNAGCRAGKTTVFVQDGDAVRRLRELAEGRSWPSRMRTEAYCRLYERLARGAVARADLSLLKGRAVHERYGRFAKNAVDFYDTSYSLEDVIPADKLDAKVKSLSNGRPLRCISLGRLMDFKCVDHAIRGVVGAVKGGARLELDIIGDGPDESRLRQLVNQLAAGSYIRFLGARPYGHELLTEIAGYDLLVFTSLAEETPRALFDGLAAGCALLAYESTYTRQMIDEINHGSCVPTGHESALLSSLVRIDQQRSQLQAWMTQAANAAPQHAASAWYSRRAAWTMAACASRRRKEDVA